MNIQEAIEKIKARFTGDAKKDIDTIFNALNESKNAIYYEELEEEMNKLLDEIVRKAANEDKKALLNYIKSKNRTSYDKKMDLIQKLIYQKKFQEALEELSTFENEINDTIENVRTKVDLPTAVFRYYRNGFEKTLCNKLYPEKSVINLDINLPEVLESKAQLLFVLKRYDEAYETAKKVYEYNPISVIASITLASISLQRRNIYAFSSSMEKAKDFTYSVFDFFNYNFLMASYYNLIEQDATIANDVQRYFNTQKTPVTIINNLPKGLKEQLEKKKFLLDLSDIVKDTFFSLIEAAKTAEGTVNKTSIYYKKLNEFYSEQEIEHMLLKRALTKDLTVDKKSKK